MADLASFLTSLRGYDLLFALYWLWMVSLMCVAFGLAIIRRRGR